MNIPEALHLYLVTDESEKCHHSLLDTVKLAVAGGVTIVQYRTEKTDEESLAQEAIPLRDFLKEKGVPLIINNNIDLALRLNADGLHIGQSDIPVLEARERLGPDKILGLSVSNKEQVLAASPDLVDYLGMGPIFPTISKRNAPPEIGVELFAELAALTPLPVVAIGGLDVERTKAVRATGQAAGVAIVSAICAAEDPTAAAQSLC